MARSKLKTVTFMLSDSHHVVTPVEWKIPGKHLKHVVGLERDEWEYPRYVLDEEFVKCLEHYSDRLPMTHRHYDLLMVLFADKDKRIQQITEVERRGED